MKKKLALVLAAGMVASMAACGNTNSSGSASAGNSKDTSATAESTDSDLAYVKDKGTLVVGITDFEPMDYQDENGNWIGFDADLASAFAESLGVDVEFVEIDWDNKILELDGKTIDCVWNGMTLTAVTAQSDALMEVAAGTSDAAIIDSLMAAAMVGEGTGYSNLTYTIGLNDEEYGVGFRKGSDLAVELNNFFKSSYADGSMEQIAEKYGVQAAVVEQK